MYLSSQQLSRTQTVKNIYSSSKATVLLLSLLGGYLLHALFITAARDEADYLFIIAIHIIALSQMSANLREEGECSHKVRRIEQKGTRELSHPLYD